MDDISSTLGIDMNTATPEKVEARALEFCFEMAECYEERTIERAAFEALALVFQMLRGGK